MHESHHHNSHHDHDQHGYDHERHRSSSDHGRVHSHAVPGHNGERGPLQWQVPHRPEVEMPRSPDVRDLDLLEGSFVEGFTGASDPTSFLRLAGIPFVGLTGEGRRLHLLRVEIEDMTDVGSVMPLLGGKGVRYDPLPARLASRRRQLAFVYHDGEAALRLDFAAARRLEDDSGTSQFPFITKG